MNLNNFKGRSHYRIKAVDGAITMEARLRLYGVLQSLHDMAEQDRIGFSLEDWRNECGTVACAMGYTAMQPWARALGLHFNKRWRGVLTYRWKTTGGPNEADNWDAVVLFLGLDGVTVDLHHPNGAPLAVNWLFQANRYQSSAKLHEVAERIEEFLFVVQTV